MCRVSVVEDCGPLIFGVPPHLLPGENSDEGVERHDSEINGRCEQEVADARPGSADTVAPADMVDEVYEVENSHNRLS